MNLSGIIGVVLLVLLIILAWVIIDRVTGDDGDADRGLIVRAV